MIASVRRLLGLLTPRERMGALVLFGLLVVGALFEVVGVGAVPAFVAALAAPDTVLANERVGPILRRLGLTDQKSLALWGGIALVALFAVKNLYLGFLAYATARYTQGRQATLSVRLFRHYLRSPYPFHLARNSSELVRNTNHEVGAAFAGVLTPALNIGLEVLVIALVGGLILMVEPLISVTVISVLGAITAVFYIVLRRKTAWYAEEGQQHRAASLKAVYQGLLGVKDVKVLGREAYFSDAYNRSVWFLAGANKFKAVVGAAPRLFLEVVVVTGVLAVAMLLVAQGRPTVEIIPVLALLAAGAMRLMPSFQRIMGNLQAFQWGEVSLRKIADDLEGELATARNVTPDPPATVDIALDGLTFRYDGAEDDALTDVSLTIPQGAAVAFVGQSGAGKTTLVDLLLGLLQPTAGAVRIG
ncbi:ATP-binding cassette domain-containing protein, partial [Rubrivirga sp.]|uniref:ATP-binding cassette domain-containing protein n=1 Tax=Rubrivirga sp. TaxID=1885344 RepID=UPI003C71BD55